MKLILIPAIASTWLLFSACTWVKPNEGAGDIALVKPIHAQGCNKLGTATAQTREKVAGISRKDKKVAAELLALAKNEALSMGGNTLVAIGTPKEGKQSFEVYSCE